MSPVPPSLINSWVVSFHFTRKFFSFSAAGYIFALGIRLMEGELDHLGLALKCNLLYLLAGGLSLLLAIWLLPLKTEWIPLLMLSVSLPPAVLNYMLCEQYHCQPDKVASIVLGGNALSVLVIPLAVWLALHLPG